MRIIFSALLLILMGMQTFSVDASLAPGLSLKNAMIYVMALVLAGQYVLSGKFQLQMLTVHVVFVLLIFYALFSWLVLAFVIRDPAYGAIRGAMALKTDLVDQFVVFLLFFFGVRTLKDANFVVRMFLAGVGLANLVTVLDVTGVLGLNIIPIRTETEDEYGRVQGAFGEANEHAAIVAMVLPALVSMALHYRGFKRVLWVASIAVGVAAIFMTASRGGMIGVLVAGCIGAVVFRRFVSLGRLLGLGFAGAVLVTVVVFLLTDTYSELLKERLIGLTFSGDASTASSGRIDIWGELLKRMLDSPWSFLTGFGWHAYAFMGFDYAPHNIYLDTWFNLGLPGLTALLLIYFQLLATVHVGAMSCESERRNIIIGLWVGLLAVFICLFFVQLTKSWVYVWAFAGLACRVAIACMVGGNPVNIFTSKEVVGSGVLARRKKHRRDAIGQAKG
jgi:O-antigen ligase